MRKRNSFSPCYISAIVEYFLNETWDFARNTFSLPLRNMLNNVPSKDFFCPGAALKIAGDTNYPPGCGVPPNALVLFRGSPAVVND